MRLFFIEFKESVICSKTIDYFRKNHNYECFNSHDFNQIKDEDLVIWFVQDETYKGILNICANIKELISNNTVLFITAFEENKIIIGPTYIPTQTSAIDSALFFLYQEKHEILNNELSEKIKLPLFINVLKPDFYDYGFFYLMHKIEKEINNFNVVKELYYLNKIETIGLKDFSSNIRFIYPLLDIKTKFHQKKNNEQIINDINFISSSKKDFRFNSLNKTLQKSSVGIIGGGTAGYLTAISLKATFPELEVHLIESDKIPIIGVGEATTPDLLKFLFEELKFDKLDFYKKVEPTWKLGIKFYWGKSGNYTFNYPFGEHDLVSAYLNGNIDYGSLTSVLMSQDSSFVLQKNEREYYSLTNPKRISYAYHLENGKFVGYLKNKAVELGVIRHQNTIDKVLLNDSKDKIENVYTNDGNKLYYDLYVDCSGFKSLLINKLDSDYVNFNDNLITDTAITFNANHQGKIKPYTYAESMKNGWCWNIPLRDSNHRGYVYSSKFCSEFEALNELKEKYPKLDQYKIIKFKSGRHNSFIKGNVVAIGNSYGFVEPLESTGIHMIVEHIKLLNENFEHLQSDKNNVLKEYLNEVTRNRWDYLKWFLSIHYKYNKKYNTPFWIHCREKIDVSKFQYILDIYNSNGPLQAMNSPLLNNINRACVDSLFGPYGIDNILLGQGVVPKNIDNFKKVGDKLWEFNINTWINLSERTIPLKDDIKILTQNPNLI